jgi:hypothetical protein
MLFYEFHFQARIERSGCTKSNTRMGATCSGTIFYSGLLMADCTWQNRMDIVTDGCQPCRVLTENRLTTGQKSDFCVLNEVRADLKKRIMPCLPPKKRHVNPGFSRANRP